jgi:glycosyltransferase involved in cell wall biosynthesis
MKIAILTPTFSQFSGIDRVVELQAEELAKKGNKVTIFTLKAGMKPKNTGLIYIGMPKKQLFERLYRLLFFLDFIKIRKYGKMLKDYNLVISHFYPMNLFGCYAKKHFGVKYVYHNHGVAYPELFNGILERNYMRLFRFFNNLTAKKADSAVSVSRFLRKVLKKETGMDSKVEYDPIDKKRFHHGISGDKIRKKYALARSPVCLYVGRISPHKGVHLLIKAFGLVLKKMPDAKLIITGKPTFDSYFSKLKKICGKSVIFAGFVEDKELPYYYSACDVYATASLWEGFNMTIAEAQACGKPVVAFDLCSHPEVVKKGKLVLPGNTKAFADAIVEVLSKK